MSSQVRLVQKKDTGTFARGVFNELECSYSLSYPSSRQDLRDEDTEEGGDVEERTSSCFYPASLIATEV